MRTTIHKWFWAWDFDKEEKWLNEMAAMGLALTSVSLSRYEFEPCLPGEYNIRVELLEKLPSRAESRHYISFVEDMGATHVGTFMRWVYFRKNTADGPFDLFSDKSSQISHLNRILLLLGVFCGLNLYWVIYSRFLIENSFGTNFLWALNLVAVLFLAYGFIKINRKKKKLKKEQQIFE